MAGCPDLQDKAQQAGHWAVRRAKEMADSLVCASLAVIQQGNHLQPLMQSLLSGQAGIEPQDTFPRSHRPAAVLRGLFQDWAGALGTGLLAKCICP